jgi:hypothetical protein
MTENRSNILGLPAASMIAVLADAAILASVSMFLLTTGHIDRVPRLVIGIAFVIVALNVLIILLGRRMQRRTLQTLRLVALVGNAGLLVVSGLAAMLAFALLGSGGAGGLKGSLEVAVYLAPIAAAVALNMKVIAGAKPPPC